MMYYILSDGSKANTLKYGISSIPTLLLFKNGALAAQTTGFMQKPDLERFAAQ